VPQQDLTLPQVRGLGQTQRADRWWASPLATFLGLAGFVLYSTWAALQGEHYFFAGGGAQYLSPMYSPTLFTDVARLGSAPLDHAWIGAWPRWLPKALWLLPVTPAFLILWIPVGFRLTCYYYRGAYYKAFWGDPLACAVGEPAFRGERYRGERTWPLLIQNIHRYFLYLAVVFIGILSYDAIISYGFVTHDEATGAPARSLGVGVGSLVLTLNAVLLGGYTFGCHSLRHLVGGRFRTLPPGPRRGAYACVSCLNRRHMLWAWASLVWVGFTDLYIRLCSMGVLHDLRLL
jgi:hypothetical protein